MRSNNAMGLVRYRQGKFAQAAAHFRTAVDKLTRRNPNPRDGEVFYNLGLALKAMGCPDEAYGMVYKAIGDVAWQTPAFYALAEIDCLRRDFETAIQHLTRLVGADGSAYPMVLYALGFIAAQLGDDRAANDLYARASEMNPAYCFPSRLEEMRILEHAYSVRPDDPWVAYYLGNLTYDKKRYEEAIALWERSVAINPDVSIPWRNLGIAAFNVEDDPDKAIARYEQAFAVNPWGGRVLSELVQLRELR